MEHADILLFHYDTLEMLLYEVALSGELSNAQCSGYNITRLDILFRCLEATKLFFNDFYSVPSHYFAFLPFTIWCQFGHAVVTLSRLSLFRGDNGWDLEYVRSTIDFDQTIDKLAQKLEGARKFIEQASGTRSSAELPEIFGRLAHRMRVMKESHHQKKAAFDKACLEDMDLVNFDFQYNMPFDTYFSFDEFVALQEGFEMPQSL